MSTNTAAVYKDNQCTNGCSNKYVNRNIVLTRNRHEAVASNGNSASTRMSTDVKVSERYLQWLRAVAFWIRERLSVVYIPQIYAMFRNNSNGRRLRAKDERLSRRKRTLWAHCRRPLA